MFSINVQPGSPSNLHDFWVLHFLRTYADCIVTTGMNLRKEPNAFNPNAITQLGFDPKVFFKTPKPVAILTNSLSSNLVATGNPVFRD